MSVKKYFLGGNTAEGFYSCYENLTQDNRIFLYIIKGGPGCGKSTFMKKIGKAAENAGSDVEYVFCSGDPDSLDAVCIPQKGIAYMDGTAPHVQEPLLAGISGTYLNFASFLDTDKLCKKKEEAFKIQKAYREQYKEAYRLLAALPVPKAENIPQNAKTRFTITLTNRGFISFEPEADGMLTEKAGEGWIFNRHPIWPNLIWSAERIEDGKLLRGFEALPQIPNVILHLKKAKQLHDALEALYQGCIDFAEVEKLTEEHLKKF